MQVQTETPGSAIFVMKYAARVRHIEVQVLADRHAQAISVFGRDCTLQVLHPRSCVYLFLWAPCVKFAPFDPTVFC